MYRVTTWDIDEQAFTPQQGVPEGPYTKWQLRGVLRKLKSIGYDIRRADAFSIMVERVSADAEAQRTQEQTP